MLSSPLVFKSVRFSFLKNWSSNAPKMPKCEVSSMFLDWYLWCLGALMAELLSNSKWKAQCLQEFLWPITSPTDCETIYFTSRGLQKSYLSCKSLVRCFILFLFAFINVRLWNKQFLCYLVRKCFYTWLGKSNLSQVLWHSDSQSKL